MRLGFRNLSIVGGAARRAIAEILYVLFPGASNSYLDLNPGGLSPGEIVLVLDIDAAWDDPANDRMAFVANGEYKIEFKRAAGTPRLYGAFSQVLSVGHPPSGRVQWRLKRDGTTSASVAWRTDGVVDPNAAGWTVSGSNAITDGAATANRVQIGEFFNSAFFGKLYAASVSSGGGGFTLDIPNIGTAGQPVLVGAASVTTDLLSTMARYWNADDLADGAHTTWLDRNAASNMALTDNPVATAGTLAFDGIDYGEMTGYTPAGSHTVLVAATPDAASDNLDRIYSSETASGTGLYVAVTSGGQIRARIDGADDFAIASLDLPNGLGNPTRFGASFDGTNLTVVEAISGLTATVDASAIGAVAHNTPAIGKRATSLASRYEGTIDAIVVGDSAATASEMSGALAEMAA